MKKRTLSPKEETIMKCFWENGPLFVKEIIDLMDEPKPHFNTISTFIRGLESKGWVGHEQFGKSFRYFPLVKASEYREWSFKGIIDKLFGKSYLGLVSALVEDEKISTDELRDLITKIEEKNKDSHKDN